MSGRLTIWIDGREALPVRAIPYVAAWDNLYHPETIAKGLARKEAAPFDRLRNLVAYHGPAGKPLPVMASEWTAVVAEVKGFEAELRERRPDVDAMDDHAGYAAWRKGAALKLPAGVFVWLDEFLREREADRRLRSSSVPDDTPVILAPMLDADTRAAMVEGFEDCPRRGPDADLAMIDYAEFVAICQVDEPANFRGYRMEANGLYVILPPVDATTTPKERAAVAWHPTGQYDKPALPLPCTLGQLRAFLPDAGMAGSIDEEVVTAILGDREESPADAASEDDAVKVSAGATAKKPGPKPGQQRKRMATILDALEAWATAQSLPFDRNEMPGKVGDGAEDEGGFHWFCAKLHRDFQKGKHAFVNHRAGLCKFPPGARANDIYRNALADVTGKLKADKEFSGPTKKRRKPA